MRGTPGQRRIVKYEEEEGIFCFFLGIIDLFFSAERFVNGIILSIEDPKGCLFIPTL